MATNLRWPSGSGLRYTLRSPLPRRPLPLGWSQWWPVDPSGPETPYSSSLENGSDGSAGERDGERWRKKTRETNRKQGCLHTLRLQKMVLMVQLVTKRDRQTYRQRERADREKERWVEKERWMDNKLGRKRQTETKKEPERVDRETLNSPSSNQLPINAKPNKPGWAVYLLKSTRAVPVLPVLSDKYETPRMAHMTRQWFHAFWRGEKIQAETLAGYLANSLQSKTSKIPETSSRASECERDRGKESAVIPHLVIMKSCWERISGWYLAFRPHFFFFLNSVLFPSYRCPQLVSH